MKKKTAVEWLVEAIQKQIDSGYGFDPRFDEKIINQSKEMEQTNSIEDLITRNYNAQIRRGQITSDTTFSDFKLKIHEELKELSNSYYENVNFDPKELGDIILVCFSMAEHFNINIMQVLSDKVAYNEKRED